MRRTLPSPACLELSVEQPEKPGLRWEAAAGSHLLLRQDRDVVLAASVEPYRAGVKVVRADRYRSPIPPLRAARARRMSPSRMPEWSLSWAHRFAEGLASNPLGPLHTGRWLLRSPESYEFGCHRPVREHPHAYLNWFDGWGGTLPLRRLPDVDSARVKAYRRQVRERVLPPVLLWYASGLDGYVLLDGHARLVAAIAEKCAPPVLLLGRAGPADTVSTVVDTVTADHRTILDGLARTKGRDHPAYRAFAERARQQIADLCVSEPRRFAPTRAWPLPGGGPAWERIAADIRASVP